MSSSDVKKRLHNPSTFVPLVQDVLAVVALAQVVIDAQWLT